MKLPIILCVLCCVSLAVHGQVWRDGGIIRGAVTNRTIALEFTGDEFAESGRQILDELERRHIHASFFLTGRCLRRPDNHPLIERIVRDGNYLGPHSNAHPLLCSWGDRKTLVTQAAFRADLDKNLAAIEMFGVKRSGIRFFLPPYEWYNGEIAAWTRAAGMQLVDFTPGTRSNADYTEEDARNYASSKTIYDSILRAEAADPHGASGWLLLMHLGAGPKRSDKMASRLGELIDQLEQRGYRFVRIDQMLINDRPPPVR